jgi:hypothetical protein
MGKRFTVLITRLACPTHWNPRKSPCLANGARRPMLGKPSKAVCAEGQNRTGDTWFFRPLLYQLSYLGGTVILLEIRGAGTARNREMV